jgi:CTP:phosphocholine cytidylyltransferase-like protein
MTPKIYIGSTIQPLHKRFKEHKYAYEHSKKISSSFLFQYEDVNIEELHIFECESIKELRAKEQEFIMLHKDVVVNKYLLDTKENIRKNIQKKQIEINPNFSKEHYEKHKEYQQAYRKTEEYKAKRRELYKLKKNIQIN